MNPERTLAITPTYQEAANLPELLAAFYAAEPEADLLLVDDVSGDGTGAWVRSRPEYGTRLFLIERDGKRGLGTAYIEGFRWALARDYRFIFEMDADLSHDPKMIARMRRRLAAGDDVVVGSRYLGGVRILNWPISRLLLSLCAAQYVRLLTGLPATDPTSGFKGFRREVLETIDLGAIRSTGYAFQIEGIFLAWWHGYRLGEVPIVFEDRHAGTSKMSHRIAFEALVEVPRLALRRLWGRPRRRG
jgi:dolichol-phosphate mannosyltransferase